MLIKETWIDATRHLRLGSSGLYEPFTQNKGELFRHLQKVYGKCISFIFVGKTDPIKVGWVFQKTAKYEDTKEKYISETWVELHDQEPEVHTVEHFHAL